MSTQQQSKPTLKLPEQKPFKMAQPDTPLEVIAQPRSDKWAPLDTAPKEADAIFMVRALANGKPVLGTETRVRYRASRKMVGGKWKPAFTIVDDKLGTKLGFRPNEWRELPAEDK